MRGRPLQTAPVWLSIGFAAILSACAHHPPEPTAPERDPRLDTTEASGGPLLWARPLYEQASGDRGPVSLVVDADDNLALAGSIPAGPAGQSLLIARYPQRETPSWTQMLVAQDWGTGAALAQTGPGDLILAAPVLGVVRLGAAGEIGLPNRWNLLLAGFKADDGRLLWQRMLSIEKAVRPFLAIASDGTIFLAGTFFSSLGSGGGALRADPEGDCFLASYSASGQPLWIKRFGGPGRQILTGLVITGSDQLILTGVASGSMDLLGEQLSPSASERTWLALVDRQGRARSVRMLQGAAVQLRDLSTTQDATYLTGSHRGSMSIGGLGLKAGPASEPCFVARLDASAAPVWLKSYGATGELTCQVVRADDQGALYLAGRVKSGTEVGGALFRARGTYSLFTARLDAQSGSWLGWTTLGDSSRAPQADPRHFGVDAMALERTGDLLLGADFAGALPLGGQAIYRGPPAAFLIKLRGDLLAP